MIRGVFLHYRNAAHSEETLAALNRLNSNMFNIQPIEANPEIVSNLVPGVLQQGAESWLILYLPDRERELLILPFPPFSDNNDLPLLRNLEEFCHYIERHWDDWYYIIRLFDRNWRRHPFNRQHQFLRIDVSLSSLLDRGQVSRQQGEQREIQSTLQRSSQSIQEKREALIWAQKTHGAAILDEVFMEENADLFKLAKRKLVQTMPQIVKDFEDIIDDETKDFLITSETVGRFAYKYSPDNFDYSAPGCGLWKAIEREMNLSLVLFLRHHNGVATFDNPWIGRVKPDAKFNVTTGSARKVNLNEREPKKSNTLKGIDLGSMIYMLRWAYRNGVKAKFRHLSLENAMLQYLFGPRSGRWYQASDTLPWWLDQIRIRRNGHAHISAMSRNQFKELRDLVLPSDSKSETCLVKILQLKRKVYEYRAKQIWEEYQKQHNLSDRIGQTAGIDPKSERIWFGSSEQEIVMGRKSKGLNSLLFFKQVR